MDIVKNKGKIALGYFGIMETYDFLHFRGDKSLAIDYKKSVENHQEYLINFFYEKGFEVDKFMSTYSSSLHQERKWKDELNLKDIITLNTSQFIGHNITSRNFHFINLLNLINLNGGQDKYDYIILTRPDLYFLQKFNEANINWNRINFTFMTENLHCVDDNFYIIPSKYFQPFLKVSRLWASGSHPSQAASLINQGPVSYYFHYLTFGLYDEITTDDTHYICKGGYRVSQNPFYNIVRGKKVNEKWKWMGNNKHKFNWVL